MVATVGFDGEQIPELQGEYSRKLHIKIWEHSDDRTEWNGFPSLIIDCNPKQL